MWRTGTVLAVLVGVWAALAATRIPRGEEDAGRWDLLLAGRVPIGAVVAAHLGVLIAPSPRTGTAVTARPARRRHRPGRRGRPRGLARPGRRVLRRAAVLAAQLLPDRGSAAGAAVAVLVAGLLARMVGDGVTAAGLAALAVAVRPRRPHPPLRRQPHRCRCWSWPGPRPRCWPPPSPSPAGATCATASSAPGSPARRGPGCSAPCRPSPSAGSAARWPAGRSASARTSCSSASIAESMTGFLTDNPPFADLAAQAGFAELGSVEGYAATLFALLAIPVGGFTAVRIAALAHAETARRLDLLLAAPITRRRLLGAEAHRHRSRRPAADCSRRTRHLDRHHRRRRPAPHSARALAGSLEHPADHRAEPRRRGARPGLGTRARHPRRDAARRRRVPAQRRRRQHRRPGLGQRPCPRSTTSPPYRSTHPTGPQPQPCSRSQPSSRWPAPGATPGATSHDTRDMPPAADKLTPRRTRSQLIAVASAQHIPCLSCSATHRRALTLTPWLRPLQTAILPTVDVRKTSKGDNKDSVEDGRDARVVTPRGVSRLTIGSLSSALSCSARR